MQTRSKASIEQSVEELMTAFQPPDLTPDMLCTEQEKDQEFSSFLMDTFYTPMDLLNDGGAVGADGAGAPGAPGGDDEDPDYAVEENEWAVTEGKEEYRMDRSTKISNKERDDLLGDLVDFMDIGGVRICWKRYKSWMLQ